MVERQYETCPECGAEFKSGRLACPECGSDAQTGWQDEGEIQYQSVEIPDYYADPDSSRGKPGHLFLIAAVLALLGMLVYVLF